MGLLSCFVGVALLLLLARTIARASGIEMCFGRPAVSDRPEAVTIGVCGCTVFGLAAACCGVLFVEALVLSGLTVALYVAGYIVSSFKSCSKQGGGLSLVA